MKNKIQIAVSKIKELDSSEFSRIVNLNGKGTSWHYVGSNPKSEGWMLIGLILKKNPQN